MNFSEITSLFNGTSKSEIDSVSERSWEVMSNLFSVGRRLDPEYGAPKGRMLRTILGNVYSRSLLGL